MRKSCLIIICMAIISSCSRQLDLYPHSAVSVENVSLSDIDQLLNGVYNVVQNAPETRSYIIFDLLGGNVVETRASSGGVLPLIDKLLKPESEIISNAWNGYYQALYQVNALLKTVKALPASQRKDELLGTIHFFRGYIYYNLITRWGGVPIIEENTNEKLKRNSEDEVWKFIENELQMAIDDCPSFTNYFYVSKPAAMALMARTKLAEGRMKEAALLAEELINSGLFQLDDFSAIFRGKSNQEEIFAFGNLMAESKINISSYFLTYAHPQRGGYGYAPAPEVMDIYADNDKRKAISIDIFQGNNVFNKYFSGQANTDPIVVTRLAEMYLISAEGQGIEGLNRLNQLRVARGLSEITPVNKDEYIKAVYQERRRELLVEGFRWYDLVRTRRAMEELGIKQAQLKFPIPENELILNKLLEQNSGY